MSGTASIGSRLNAKPPATATAATSVTTSQRCAIEKSRMRRIMAGLVGVLKSVGLAELGLEDECVTERDALAGLKTCDDLGDPAVVAAGFHGARLEAFRGADKDHRLAFYGLDRRAGYDDVGALGLQRNVGGNEGAGPPQRCGILDQSHDARRMGVLVEQRVDQHDRALRFAIDGRR